MNKCCICGTPFWGKGIESQGMFLPVCGKPCLDRKVEAVSKKLEAEDIQEPFHQNSGDLQATTPVVVPT